MTIFIDLVGAWAIRISMIAMMLTLTVTMNDTLYQASNRANTKAYLVAVDSIMYKDINLAGYGTVVGTKYWIVLNNVGQWVTPDAVFWTATSTDCEFFADINNDGTPEVVEYYAVKDATTGLYTMTRTVNDWKSPNPPVIGKSFTNVNFTYFDALGVVTTTRANAVAMRIQLSQRVPGTTSGFTTGPSFTTATVEFNVTPANL